MPRKYSRLTWGKNFRRAPSLIQSQLETIGERAFVVGCAKIIGDAELSSGLYRHLEIESAEDLSSTAVLLLPSSTVGRTSYYNCTVEERKNQKIGKVVKLIRGKAPNWRGSGYHRTQRHQDVWPTKLVTPNLSHIEIQRIRENEQLRTLVVRFRIMEVLIKGLPEFNRELLRCINLLQENVGKAEIFEVTATEEEYIRRCSEDIGWEMLPNASTKETIDVVVRKLASRNQNTRRIAQNRLEVIMSLKPLQQMQGSKGFSGYFAAQFTSELIVFENLELDHALYVVRANWENVSRLTRSEIRAKYAQDHERIVHSKGWEGRLTRVVQEARGDVWDKS